MYGNPVFRRRKARNTYARECFPCIDIQYLSDTETYLVAIREPHPLVSVAPSDCKLSALT